MTPLTFIMPVFNAEATVAASIHSVKLLKDLLPNKVQMIAVDDCSTDGSLNELNRAAAQHDFVRVLQMPKNGGPGPARNLALSSIHAGYVGFIDADDQLLPEGYATCFQMGEQAGADFVTFNGRVINDGTVSGKYDFTRLRDDTASLVRSCLRSELDGSVIFSIYRRDLIELAGLYFLSDFYEDIPFSNLALIRARRRQILDIEAYQKAGTAGSIVNSISSRHIIGLFNSIEKIYEELKINRLLYDGHEADFYYGAHGYIAKMAIDAVKSGKHTSVEKQTLLQTIYQEIADRGVLSTMPKLTNTRKDTICTTLRHAGENRSIALNTLEELSRLVG